MGDKFGIMPYLQYDLIPFFPHINHSLSTMFATAHLFLNDANRVGKGVVKQAPEETISKNFFCFPTYRQQSSNLHSVLTDLALTGVHINSNGSAIAIK